MNQPARWHPASQPSQNSIRLPSRAAACTLTYVHSFPFVTLYVVSGTACLQVVVIEEAGELLEAQLIAALTSPELEHVVLIGDHQQLRPKINTYELELHHKFHISLFERLILLGHPSVMLETQLRMRSGTGRGWAGCMGCGRASAVWSVQSGYFGPGSAHTGVP